MKKLNVICAAVAMATMASGVYAGSLNSVTAGGTRFAVEAWGSATNDATAILPGAITYSVATTNGIVVNGGGQLFYTVRLTNALFPVAGPATTTLTGTVVALAGGAPQVALAGISTDRTTAIFRITFVGNQNIGVGATLIYTPAAGDILASKGTLSSVGGVVNVTAGLSALPGSATPGSTVPADVDGPAVTAPLAQSINGITLSLLNTGLTSKINVGASPANTAYIDGSSLTTGQLGRLRIAVPVDSNSAPLPAFALDGITPYTVSNYVNGAGGSLAITLTPTGGAFASAPTTANPAPAGNQARVFVSGATTICDVGLGLADSGILTPALAAQPVTLTVSGANIPAAGADGGVNLLVCQGTSRTATGAASISPVTPTISATLNPVTANGANAESVSGTGYALTFNGAVVTTNGYWPAALSQFGYTMFTRVINTGTTPTEIRGQFITQTTGVVGMSNVLPLPSNYGGTLVPGASVTWTNAQVESALGAPGAADRPTLRITGQTSRLTVQTFIQSPTGAITEVSGGVAQQ